MTEEERRTGYSNTRILIESSRVLDPQFSDAVLRITGSQIEMLRNVVQYLDRPTTFVAEYEPQYYLTPDVDDWDNITYIVASLQEVLMGNENVVFGYYAQLLEDVSGDADLGGDFSGYTGTPPVGQVWAIQVATVLDSLNSPTLIRMLLDNNGSYFVFHQVVSPAANTPVVYSGLFMIQNTQRIRLDVLGTSPSASIAALVLGYKMQVPV